MLPSKHCELQLCVLGSSLSDGAALQGSGVRLVDITSLTLLRCASHFYFAKHLQKLSVTDVLARTLRKGAAKCEMHCDLQNSGNQITI